MSTNMLTYKSLSFLSLKIIAWSNNPYIVTNKVFPDKISK